MLVETIPLTELWLRGGPYLNDPVLAESAVAHRRYLEQGIDFSFGTDNKPYNPFATLWAAVARRERVTDQMLGPGQRLTRLEALRAFTIGGARFSLTRKCAVHWNPVSWRTWRCCPTTCWKCPNLKYPGYFRY